MKEMAWIEENAGKYEHMEWPPYRRGYKYTYEEKAWIDRNVLAIIRDNPGLIAPVICMLAGKGRCSPTIIVRLIALEYDNRVDVVKTPRAGKYMKMYYPKGTKP